MVPSFQSWQGLGQAQTLGLAHLKGQSQTAPPLLPLHLPACLRGKGVIFLGMEFGIFQIQSYLVTVQKRSRTQEGRHGLPGSGSLCAQLAHCTRLPGTCRAMICVCGWYGHQFCQ